MKPHKTQDRHRKRIYGFSALTFVILYALYCFALVPMYLYFANDIIYMNTALPWVLELLYGIAEIAAIAVGYATAIYSLYRFGFGQTKAFFVIFALAEFLKYTVNILITWFSEGIRLSSLAEDIILNIAVPCILEYIQFAIVVFISYRIINKLSKKYEVASGAASSFGRAYPERDSTVYPFKNIVNFKNPILRSALTGGIVVCSTKVLSRMIYDVFYGLPDDALEVLGMALYYLSDVVTGVFAYFVIIYILMMFFHMYARDTALGD